MKSFFNLLSITKNHKKRYLLGVLFIILVDILQLIYPVVLAKVTDEFELGTLSKNSLLNYAILIFVIGFLIFLFRFIWRVLIHGTGRLVEKELRIKFYDHLTKQSSYFYNKNSTGDLMAHATNDINNVFISLGQGMAFLFDSTFIPIFAIIMLIIIGGIKLTLITCIPLIFLGVSIFILSKFMQKSAHKMQESFSDLTEFSRESISGIRVLKSFAQESDQLIKFVKFNDKNRLNNINYLTYISMLFPLVMGISAISYAVVLWYGGYLVVLNEISLGDFVAFSSYIGMLTWPVAAFGWMLNIFQRGIVSKERVDKILNTIPEIDDSVSDKDVKTLDGAIEFINVNFSYPDTKINVLENISFKIEKGKSLAIIGKTGSGKTTIVKLLMRMYELESDGQILIDSKNIKKIPFDVLRKDMKIVPQDSILFSETISSNISFFRDFSQAEIEKVAKISKVYDDVIEFPDKFETFVGEKGVTLSGGQKQRISISRAVIGDPNIIIFDDCLSAVDARTEEDILSEFDKNLKDKTRIIVSHRISAIQNADHIIVLKDGKIHEEGTHSKLISNKDFYYDLHNMQILEKRVKGV